VESAACPRGGRYSWEVGDLPLRAAAIAVAELTARGKAPISLKFIPMLNIFKSERQKNLDYALGEYTKRRMEKLIDIEYIQRFESKALSKDFEEAKRKELAQLRKSKGNEEAIQKLEHDIEEGRAILRIHNQWQEEIEEANRKIEIIRAAMRNKNFLPLV
jgi:hypothetical protein